MAYDDQIDGILLNDEEVKVYGWSIYDINDTWLADHPWLADHDDVPGYYLHFTDDAGTETTLAISRETIQKMLSEIRERLDDHHDNDDVAYGADTFTREVGSGWGTGAYENEWTSTLRNPIVTSIVSGDSVYSVTEE